MSLPPSNLPRLAELAIQLDTVTTAVGTLQGATVRHADILGRLEAKLQTAERMVRSLAAEISALRAEIEANARTEHAR